MIKKFLVGMSMLFLGILLIILGISRGEALEVMDKAIVVCLSCIGIG